MRSCAREVLHLVHVGADAGHEGDVVGGEVGEVELYQLRIVAEAAVGFAPERVGERGFGVEEMVREGVELAAIRLAASDDAVAFGDQRDDEQPEAREHSGESGKVAQQPCGNAAFVLHGRDYTPAISPADLAPVFPPNFSRKCLRFGRSFLSFPQTRTTVFPQTRRRSDHHQRSHSRPCAEDLGSIGGGMRSVPSGRSTEVLGSRLRLARE